CSVAAPIRASRKRSRRTQSEPGSLIVFWGAHAPRVLAIAPSRSRTFSSHKRNKKRAIPRGACAPQTSDQKNFARDCRSCVKLADASNGAAWEKIFFQESSAKDTCGARKVSGSVSLDAALAHARGKVGQPLSRRPHHRRRLHWQRSRSRQRCLWSVFAKGRHL